MSKNVPEKGILGFFPPPEFVLVHMDAVDLPLNLTLDLRELFLERNHRVIPNNQDIDITMSLHCVACIRAKNIGPPNSRG